jgi:hypothetical protein
MCTHLEPTPQKKFQTLTTSDWKAAIGSNSRHDLQRIASISVSQIPARIEVEKPHNDKLGSQKNTGHSGTSLHSPGASNWQDVKAAFCAGRRRASVVLRVRMNVMFCSRTRKSIFGSTVALNDVEGDFCKFGGHCVKREVHVDSEWLEEHEE